MSRSLKQTAIAMLAGKFASGQAYRSCPSTSIFPKLEGIEKNNDLAINETKMLSIDYSENFEFIITGGSIEYIYAPGPS